ncbi:MAG: carboxypeptidase-like regulatory domain-containing protein [Chitinophagaceae bacterium]
MKKIFFFGYLIFLSLCLYAQERIFDNPFYADSVVQVWGMVSKADSANIPISMAVVRIKNQNRGTFTTQKGTFSIVVLPGDEITISHIGFKTVYLSIPKNYKNRNYETFVEMEIEVLELPTVKVRSYPSPEEFRRDLLNTDFPDDAISIAQKNINYKTIRNYLKYMPKDAIENINYMIKTQVASYYYYGQLPPMPIFDPLAWARFIQAWKSGELKD